MERLSPRGRRGLILISLALVALVTTVSVYLWPLVRLARTAHAAATGQSWQLDFASFGTADRGAATMSRGGAISTFVTVDGGRTWRRRSTEPAATMFLDRDHAVMLDLGQQERLGITADAGRTWDTGFQPITLGQFAMRPSVFLGGPFFLDPADGWWLASGPGAAGYALWRTTDGGHTWDDLAPSGIPATNEALPHLVFVDRMRGALVAQAGRGQWPSLLTTRDGGRTWQPVAVAWPPADIAPADPADPSLAMATLLAHGYRILVSLDILVGGSRGPVQAAGRSLSVSDDGGLTWSPWEATPGSPAIGSAMAFDDAGRLAVADVRHLWSSTDLGHSWHVHPLPAPGGRAVSSEVLAAGGGALFVVTQRGTPDEATSTLLRSLDGGASWTTIPLPQSAH